MDHLYRAFSDICSKRFDTHYYTDRSRITIDSIQLPRKHTTRLPVKDTQRLAF